MILSITETKINIGRFGKNGAEDSYENRYFVDYIDENNSRRNLRCFELYSDATKYVANLERLFGGNK